MATFSSLNARLTKFIESQPMFFVATAAREGNVNVSPKGMDTLKVLNHSEILWLNLTGSGNETAAHVLETTRMTLMFCAFEGQAMILRTYGNAEVIHPRDPHWADCIGEFADFAGSRQLFKLHIKQVQTSCGTGVPFMSFQGERGEEELLPYYRDMGEEGVKRYWRKKNEISIDGKPTGIFSD